MTRPGFDAWASLERERCHREASRLLDWLARLQADAGVLPAVHDTAARCASLLETMGEPA